MRVKMLKNLFLLLIFLVFNSTSLSQNSVLLPNSSACLDTRDPITRDFRYSCGIQYQASNLVFNQQKSTATLTLPLNGWQANYIEMSFADGL